MNSSKVRVFLITSHISLVYATLLAKSTAEKGVSDILFIDANKRKKSAIRILHEASEIYPWALFNDFSLAAGESIDYKPTLRQSFFRRIKNKVIIRNVYRFFLKRHLKQTDHRFKEQLKKILTPFIEPEQEVELFLLTQTVLNRPLLQLFPDATLNYIEHGHPDYFNFLEPDYPKGNLFCIFSTEFRTYLHGLKLQAVLIRDMPGTKEFPAIAAELISKHSIDLKLKKLQIPAKHCVFILLESVEIYNVNIRFHQEYMDRIFAQLDSPGSYHYILKPHPMQSSESIKIITEHLEFSGFSYTLLNENYMGSISAEVLFSIFENRVRHVFCLFSAAGFYLSKLYSDKGIKFWYSTDFMRQNLGKAPLQFSNDFHKALPLIENVMAGNCQKY
ncbi:hypothetical protein BH09BAC5_BH09BAC5_22090 [soil metagenome]